MSPVREMARVLIISTAVFCGRSALAAAPPATSPTAKVFDIPRLDSIQIDGNDQAWGDNGFRVNALASTDGFEAPASEFNARFRLAWNQQGLLVLVTVHNTAISEMSEAESLWKGDAVEFCLAPAIGATDRFQAIIAPGADTTHDRVRTHISDLRTTASLKALPIDVKTQRTKMTDGYVVESLLPWSTLGIVPAIGRTVAFQLMVDTQRRDTDGGLAPLRVAWYPNLNSVGNMSLAYTVCLSDHASPPISMAASAGYARLRRLHVDVVTDASLGGKDVRVVAPDGTTASAKVDSNPAPSITTLQLPLPSSEEVPMANKLMAADAPASNLDVSVGDQHSIFPVFHDLAQARFMAFRGERLAVRNFIFQYPAFPKIEFERPSEVEDLIGEYQLKTTFYDANFQPVKFATQPGRYGAVIEIVTSHGVVDRRYQTLYKAPKVFDWRGPFDSGTLQMPPEMGLDETVLSEQDEAISELMRQSLSASLTREQGFAVVFCSLFESHPGDVGVRYQNPARRDDAWWVALKKSIGQFQQYQTVVHLPPGYVASGGKHWPLILFLHGSDQHSDDPDLIRTQGLCAYAIAHPELPFVVISPTSPPGQWFSPATLGSLLDDAIKQYDVDPDRVYLTGLSLGGFGTWDLAAQTPERFAAAVPIAGIGDPDDAERLKDLPMWVFHGEVDPTVSFPADRQCVDAVRAVGGRIKFTTYPGVGHNSWTQTYANPALYAWLLEQRRGAPAQSPATRPTTMEAKHLFSIRPSRLDP